MTATTTVANASSSRPRLGARALDTASSRATSAAAALPVLVLPVLLALALVGQARTQLGHVRGPHRSRAADTGASVVEWVLVVAIVVGITVAVGAIIRTRVVDKSNDLDLTTP